jgi:hypothetical protein
MDYDNTVGNEGTTVTQDSPERPSVWRGLTTFNSCGGAFNVSTFQVAVAAQNWHRQPQIFDLGPLLIKVLHSIVLWPSEIGFLSQSCLHQRVIKLL